MKGRWGEGDKESLLRPKRNMATSSETVHYRKEEGRRTVPNGKITEALLKSVHILQSSCQLMDSTKFLCILYRMIRYEKGHTFPFAVRFACTGFNRKLRQSTVLCY
jgi:hypothetical protein